MKSKRNLGCIWGVIFTLFAFLIMFFAAVLQGHAQNVTRVCNIFVQDSSSHQIKKKDVTITKYTYKTSDGKTYPIYMSSSGKYFIIRKSQKTGKEYRKYLPEVTKMLSK